jgi:hypothetical protein
MEHERAARFVVVLVLVLVLEPFGIQVTIENTGLQSSGAA